MNSKDYYDGTKLLSLKDLDGNQPVIYICTSNRTGGKTTYFNRLVVNKFKDSGSKFMLIYRFNYELDDCADKFFKDIKELFFEQDEMKSERRASGIYHELYINGNSCGYAVALNNADTLKKYSHMFSDVDRMIFDEFQSETDHYCSKEVAKFFSIYTSVARGRGKMNRYVPVYMISNPISTINPYYLEMGISSRLDDKTKFLKGHGYVLEQGYVAKAGEAQKESGFFKAFENNKYAVYSAEAVYLNDNKAFVEKPEGKNRYICTIKYEGTLFAIREYADLGIIYCDDRADASYPIKISVTTDDHQINYVMLEKNSVFLNILRNYFTKGCFRFKNLKCKEALIKSLSLK